LHLADALTTFDGMNRTKAKKTKVETVHVGNARVKIYRRVRTVAGNEYPTFEVCDYTSGRRKLRSFADHKAALDEAMRIARHLSTGDAVAAAMSGKEAASFGRCLELLRTTTDAPELACARYAEAIGILGNGDLLTRAAKFYMERHPNTLPQITLAQAADEMVELRRQAKASGPYLSDLRHRTASFTEAFAVHPASVTTADCQQFFDGLKSAATTKNATRRVVWRLFDHCESRGYIPKGTNPVTDTKEAGGKRDDTIIVWTAEEMARLLSHASPAFLPVVAIGGFAGLRTSEIMALDWKDIRLAERSIKVTSRKARCAGTRLAPISDNLAAWLAPLAKKSGPVWLCAETAWKQRAKRFHAAQNATAAAAGLLPWRHNALRHSYCSYRVAATQDVPKTALEAGNSAGMIFKHYRALATQGEGKAWFNILPQQAANIVPMVKVA
jgi:integrase